jgi:glycosyltransferase involved in cell wall biosynthesis
MVGRLVREKGYLDLFAAARDVLQQLPNTTFIAIGGWEPTKADGLSPDEPTARELGVNLRVLGHREDIDRLYGAMDLLVLPSHREGFPRAPMEAAATGIPVVATNIRGCRDTVLDGQTGILVPVREPHALATAILSLLRDDDRRLAMGVRGRELAEQRFDQRLVFARVADAYSSLGASV